MKDPRKELTYEQKEKLEQTILAISLCIVIIIDLSVFVYLLLNGVLFLIPYIIVVFPASIFAIKFFVVIIGFMVMPFIKNPTQLFN